MRVRWERGASRIKKVKILRLWITGARHEIIYRDETGQIDAKTRRLVGNVLLWDRDGVTYRLEGAKTRAQALAAVRNLRAP